MLTLDNFAGHGQLDDLRTVVPSWLHIEFLPENTTSLIQPCDGGIIARFKRNYRKRLLSRLMDMSDRDPNLTVDAFKKAVNVLVACTIATSGWEEIDAESIAKVWRRTLLVGNTYVITAEGMTKARREELESVEAEVRQMLTNMPALIAQQIGTSNGNESSSTSVDQLADELARVWLDFDEDDDGNEITIEEVCHTMSREKEESEGVEEEEVVDVGACISHKQALEKLLDVSRYLEVNASDVGDVVLVNRLIEHVRKNTEKTLVQTSLRQYFK